MSIILPHKHENENALSKILKNMPNQSNFEDAAGIFGQLCDPTRLRILWILCHSEECVTNLSAAIGMSDSAVSHHLRILKNARLAKSRRIGKEVHYTLAKTKAAKLIHCMIDDVFEMNCPK